MLKKIMGSVRNHPKLLIFVILAAVGVFLLGKWKALPSIVIAISAAASAVIVILLPELIKEAVVTKEPVSKQHKISIAVCTAVLIMCFVPWKNLFWSEESEDNQPDWDEGADKQIEEPKQDEDIPIIVIPEASDYVDLDEIQTAVSLYAPSQIEADLEEEASYTPHLPEEDLQSLLVFQSYFRNEIAAPGEYHEVNVSLLREDIDGLLQTVPNCSEAELVGNGELGELIRQANAINHEINVNGRTIGRYEALMAIYEKANELEKSSIITLQLARPYAEIVEIYPRDSAALCDKIFQYGLKGIQHFRETLAYEEIYNEDVGDILYRIGQIYHYLADIPHLEPSLRKELYLMATAYLTLANEYPLGSYIGYTSHYAGMVFHKLGTFKDEHCAYYLQKSVELYKEGLSNGEKFGSVFQAYNCTYQADVYARLAAYVAAHGTGGVLESSATYRELAEAQRSVSATLRGG